MSTSNYKLDTRYALVDTDIIDNKKNIICTEAITYFHSISDINHITHILIELILFIMIILGA